MIFEEIDFRFIDDNGSFSKLSIVISGDKPELMISEFIVDKLEIVQINVEATHALYLALHKIYSAKP